MTNENLVPIAEKVLRNSHIPEGEDEFGFDPFTIIMIIAIIVNVIRVIQECNKNKNDFNNEEYSLFIREKIRDLARRRSVFNTMKLKKILRKHLRKEAYSKYKDYLINGLLETGLELSENETYQLLEYSND